MPGRLEAFGFILGNHPHQCADQTADRVAGSDPRQRAENRAGRYKWTHAGNRQYADSGQQAKSSTDRAARCDAGRGALRRFCMLLVSESLRPLTVGK